MSAFVRHFTIRWSDVDANGHMRNTAYSEICSDTRVAMLAAGGFAWSRFESLGLGPVLLRENIVYQREAGLGEDVRVDAKAAGLSPDGARWAIRHRLWKQDGVRMARVAVLCGWIDFTTRRLVVPPPELARVLEDLDRTGSFVELPPLRR